MKFWYMLQRQESGQYMLKEQLYSYKCLYHLPKYITFSLFISFDMLKAIDSCMVTSNDKLNGFGSIKYLTTIYPLGKSLPLLFAFKK